jgi:hypothetical protein
MPLNEGIGCLGVVLKFLAALVMGAAEGLLEGVVDFLGHVGAWTERIATFGRSKPDPESWMSIAVGFVVVVVTAVMVIGFSLKAAGEGTRAGLVHIFTI